MSDISKLNFEPIPVSGTPRPELPKVPELPSLAAKMAAKATETPPAEPPTTPTPAPTSWLPDSFWQLVQPSRTKGVLAAGVISLLGGAATMRYIWPMKPVGTAQVEPDQLAPLPATTNGTSGEVLPTMPKLIPTTPPTMPAVATVEVPTIALPPVIPATSPPIALPTLAAPTLPPVATAPTIKTLELPELVPVTGTTPMVSPPPVTLPVPTLPPVTAAPTLPSLAVPDVATTPATTSSPTALTLPTLPSISPAPTSPPPAPMAVAPPATLPLPGVTSPPPPTTEVKLELPKLDVPPPVSPIPVPGATAAPKLPEVSLPKHDTPKPVEVSLPTLGTPPTPRVDPIALPSPTAAPSLELPTPGVTTLPSVTATNTKTDYDVDLHYVKVGDSWAAVSKQHYGDDRYAEALKSYNQNATLTQLQRAEVPPIHILRKNYASAIGKPVEKGDGWGTITPSSATEPKRNGGYKTYTIPAGGRTIKEVAADAYGDETRWGLVWESNPKLTPDKTIPEGTKIYLTSQAKIGE